jgi:hypothetical protein
LGVNTRLLGWGVSFMDMDNDGWLDILVANGHVYPEVDGTQVDAAYAERKYLYRNLRNGQFEDVSLTGGPGITRPCRRAALPWATMTTTATWTRWSTASTRFRNCCTASRR